MATWVSGTTTSSGGNISLTLQGGYGTVTRSGSSVSFPYGMRFTMSGSTYTSNSICAWLPSGGTKRWAFNSNSGANRTTSGTYYYANSTSASTTTSETTPLTYSGTVSGTGATSVSVSIGTAWNGWNPSASAYTYSFSVPVPAVGSPTGSASAVANSPTEGTITGSVSSWGSNATSGSSAIVYGTTTSYGSSATSGTKITGLVPNTTYYYRFRITNGQSLYTDYTGNFKTNAAVAATSTIALTSRDASSLSVKITATKGTGTISSYAVSKDNGANWTNIGMATTYTFTDLLANTTYQVKARVYDNYTSGDSAAVAMTTLAVPTINDITFTKTNTSITTTVDASPANGSSIAGYSFSIDNVNWSTMAASNQYTFSNLTENTTYTIYVRVYDVTLQYEDGSASVKTIAAPTITKIEALTRRANSLNIKATATNEAGTSIWSGGHTWYRYSKDNGLIDRGKNIFNASSFIGAVWTGGDGAKPIWNASRTNRYSNDIANAINVSENTQYTLSSNNNNYGIEIIWLNKNNYRISSTSYRYGNYTVTSPAGAVRVLCNTRRNDDADFTPNDLIVAQIQLEQGSAATSYEAYTSSYTNWITSATYLFTDLIPLTNYDIKVQVQNIYSQVGSATQVIQTLAAPPVINRLYPILVTPSSITMKCDATSQVAMQYQFSDDNGNGWTDLSDNNTYEFLGLAAASSYEMLCRVLNADGEETISQMVLVSTGEPFKPRALRDGEDYISPITSGFSVFMEDGETTVIDAITEIGKGGHDIVDNDGDTMPKQEDLQFLDTELRDDTNNGRTVVDLTGKINSYGKTLKNIEYITYDEYMTLVANDEDDPDTEYHIETDEYGTPGDIIELQLQVKDLQDRVKELEDNAITFVKTGEF